MQRILVVDDDRVEVDVLSFLLRRAGFEPRVTFDATSAQQLFDQLQPDLVILDIQLGHSDGRELLQRFRQQRPEVLILMLTVLNAEDDRVQGLELGADDYLTKPFGHRELVARVSAMLRRVPLARRERVTPQRVQLGSVVLDPMTHEVTRAGQRVALSPTEFRLLQTLMERPNVLVPTRTLLKEVWGHEDLTARNVLRVTAGRLRAKLERDTTNPRMLVTVPGEGLIMRSDEPPASAGQALPEAPIQMEILVELKELLDEMGERTLQQLNEVFIGTVATQVSAMRTAVANGDAAALAHDAHRLRGNSASLGAQRMTKVCAMIEERSKASDFASVDALLPQLEQELDVFETALTPLLD
jgi:DNA-binding response OmpR family regulator/HPt (histidine-containing phosphotransfer) domain-containing protein